MRRLILTTVSAIALVGGGLAYAAGDMGGHAANPAASPPPAASGTSQPGTTGSNTGASGASSMPSTTGTSQPGYNYHAARTGTSQWGMSGQMSRHDQVSQAQQKLQQEGLYHGNIDGIFGRGTKQALRQYQQQNGLPVTANLDPQTLDHLLGSPPGSQGSPGQAPPNPRDSGRLRSVVASAPPSTGRWFYIASILVAGATRDGSASSSCSVCTIRRRQGIGG